MAETPVCRPKLGPSERLVNTHCDPPAHGDSRNVPTDCLFVLGKEADENQIMRTDTNGGGDHQKRGNEDETKNPTGTTTTEASSTWQLCYLWVALRSGGSSWFCIKLLEQVLAIKDIL